jgi:hypothetical protein
MRLPNLPSSDEWEGEINKVSVFDTECLHKWKLVASKRVVECNKCNLALDITPDMVNEGKGKIVIPLAGGDMTIFLKLN